MIIDGIERRVTLLGENAQSNTVPLLRERGERRHVGVAAVRRRVIGAHGIDRHEDDVGVVGAGPRDRRERPLSGISARMRSRSNSRSIASPANARSPQISSVVSGHVARRTATAIPIAATPIATSDAATATRARPSQRHPTCTAIATMTALAGA